ncbi:MAG: response regulator transcription factor [Bacteroidetes bacterium]|nr:response regulator transcription factor [Bacteroidota bacterium]
MFSNTNIRIALVEDNPVNRNTFQQNVMQYEELKIVFIANNGEECLEELRRLPPNLFPQIIFMDIEMPKLNGIQAISVAKSLYPQIHFVVLTVFDDDEKIFEAIKVGASGYLLKHETAVFLKDAIINIIEYGGAPMSPAIARKTLEILSKSTFSDGKQSSSQLPEILSDREKEILYHTVNGLDSKSMAQLLNISTSTAHNHIANIYKKLHVRSKAQVISLAHHKKWFQ